MSTGGSTKPDLPQPAAPPWLRVKKETSPSRHKAKTQLLPSATGKADRDSPSHRGRALVTPLGVREMNKYGQRQTGPTTG